MTEAVPEGLWLEGDHWALRYRGREARLTHIKGLGYLAVLLENPGAEIHVLEIVAAAEGSPAPGGAAVAGARAELSADDAAGAGAGLDARAKAAYRERVQELREELDQARDWADDERAARAQEELDFVSRELARAVGLRGRDRPTASQAERTRQNVGRAVHKAVRKIAAALPELGAHLERAVSTGLFCSYRPEPDPPFASLAEPPAPATSEPPPGSTRARRHNLLLQLTSFVGRERELPELAALLVRARLVTLTGAGGSGKTRLAIEVAARQAEQMRDGARLVDLAPVFDPELVPKAVAHVLGVRERPHSDLLGDIRERLGESELLLVLDNCEHLVEACARLAEDLVRGCPELRLLATSREPLGVPGEHVLRTGSLALPAPGDPPEVISRAEAVTLFADRASAALNSFELTPATAPVVAHVCRRLDGLPLAIELAAARTASLSLDDLASRLDDRFAVLTGGARTALPRQRTLEATVAWSYDGLSERQRRLFERLSVFAGGWTLDAAETVCAAAGMEARHLADDLAALVDKSLVVRDAPEDERTRYRLLETLRQYGRDRLRESGATAAVRDAHLAWAVGLAEEAERHLDGLAQAAWLDVLERELDNLRAALEWAIAARNPEAGLRLASITVGSLWTWRSHVPEGQRWLQRLLASPADVAPSVRAKGLLAAGRVDFQAGDWARGAHVCGESHKLHAEAGDAAGEARALIWMAFNRWGIEDDDEVGDALAAAVRAARRAGRPLETAIALGLSGTWWSLRDLDRAEQLVEEGGLLMERAANPNWLAHSHEFRALVAYLRGDYERARELISSALPLYIQIGNRVCSAHCLDTTAAMAAATGRPDAGSELLGAAERMREQLGTVAPPYERIVRERAIGAVEAALDEEATARLWERGRGLGFEDAMARARALAERPLGAPGGDRNRGWQTGHRTE